MGFVRSVLLLAGVVCSVSFAVFAGHGLSTHHAEPFLIGGGFLAAGIVLLVLFSRLGRSVADGHR